MKIESPEEKMAKQGVLRRINAILMTRALSTSVKIETDLMATAVGCWGVSSNLS